jgi:hypothetical protein
MESPRRSHLDGVVKRMGGREAWLAVVRGVDVCLGRPGESRTAPTMESRKTPRSDTKEGVDDGAR